MAVKLRLRRMGKKKQINVSICLDGPLYYIHELYEIFEILPPYFFWLGENNRIEIRRDSFHPFISAEGELEDPKEALREYYENKEKK